MVETCAESCSCPRCASDAAAASQPADPNPACYCPLDGVIDVIARKHAMHIVSQLGAHGTLQYSDLRDALAVASEATLSENLKRLEDAGIIDRTVHDTTPPTVKYSLTEPGRDLEERLTPLLAWADDL